MKKITCLFLTLALLLTLLSACAGESAKPTQQPAQQTEPQSGAALADWSVYWYLCGSDLESNGGFATTDLYELMEVALPENVKFVIQTGGSSYWQNDFVDAEKLQRFVYSSEGMELVDEQPSASMGAAETLADFLSFAKENYPADKTAVVFWNHGGGSVGGAAFDELYGNDSLTLDELHSAFEAVFALNAEAPPLELVGFDTCLMATVDVAATFADISHYLVASEETEPGNGWYYSQWGDALASDPAMDGAALGTAICDAYYYGCELAGTQENTTLSVTDLTRLEPLLASYESFGQEALAAACENPAFFAHFGRAAAGSENYGGNTREQGYTNMVDLGHLARQSAQLLPSSAGVLNALDACVLYQVKGQYRQEATGLSCYYSFNGDTEDLDGYISQGTGDAFKYFYTYELTGGLDDSGMSYISDLSVGELPEVKTLASMDWDGMPLTLDGDGTTSLTLGAEAYDILERIGFSLYRIDEENDLILLLGTDNDMNADWENGVFSDNFRGVWGSINGALVYMELSYEGDDYNLYSVPILLNGEEYNLQVVYDFSEEAWSILGARQGIDESGMADKELRLLQSGDEITTLWYLASYSGGSEFEAYPADTIIVTENTVFGETQLPDGSYSMTYEMYDAMGTAAYSEPAMFECADGQITTSIYE